MVLRTLFKLLGPPMPKPNITYKLCSYMNKYNLFFLKLDGIRVPLTVIKRGLIIKLSNGKVNYKSGFRYSLSLNGM